MWQSENVAFTRVISLDFFQLRKMKEMLAKMQAEMEAQKTGGSPVANHQAKQNGEVKSQNV